MDNKINLKEKTCLIYDYGLFTEMAVALVKDFKQVFYYVPWQSDFPSSLNQKIGQDFDGIIRIQDFWDYVDKVDLIVFFDTYSEDLVSYLRNKGYRVWGAGQAEQMELERWEMRKAQQEIGLPAQDTLRIKSLQDLITYFRGIRRRVEELTGKHDINFENAIFNQLKKKYDNFSKDYYTGKNKIKLAKEWFEGAENKFVKSNMRGDIETFYAPNYDDSLSKFNALSEAFGHRTDAKEIEFVVEDRMEGVEPGFDGIQINGEYLDPTMYGYEAKGAGYIGKICRYQELPQPIQELNKKLTFVFQKYTPTASFFSTEFIIGEDKQPYLIDPTVRNPAPVGSAIFSALIENLGEILWYGAQGIKVSPVMRYKYAAGVAFESEWADEHELEIEFPPALRPWIKFRKAYKKGDKYYVVPGFTSICSVIALGNSIPEVIDLVEKRAKQVQAYELQTGTGGLLKCVEEINEGKKYGINF